MREKERVIIVEQIKKDIDNRDNLDNKEKEINELLKNDFVKRYLDLKQEVEDIKNGFFNTSNEEIAELRFMRAMLGSDIYEGVRKCRHDVWLYLHSYKYLEDPRGEREWFDSCDNESDPDFRFNGYLCLDCNTFIKVSDWKQFENINFVLKDYYIEDKGKFASKYYQLLLEMNAEDAIDTIIKEFNDEKAKRLVK